MILTFDKKPVDEMRRLPRIVAETPVGKAVDVEVWRKGRKVHLSVSLGEFPEDESKVADSTSEDKPKSAPVVQIDELGLTLSKVTPDLREKFSLEDDADGVIITEVAPAGPAAEKRVQPGANLRKIGPEQEAVTSPAQVRKKVDEAKKAKLNTILVLIEIGGTQRFVALNIVKG